MKRTLIIILIVTIFFNIIMLSGCSRELQIMINGKNIVDKTTIITKDNEFYIPIDTLCNSINATYKYIPYKKQITISVNTSNITDSIGEAIDLKMFFDKDILCHDGVNKKADKKPFVNDDTIYIPICYTMKLLGYKVKKNSNHKVEIVLPERLLKTEMFDEENVYYTHYEYDDKGNLVKATLSDGDYFLWEYNDKGKLIKASTNVFDGIEVTYKYNINGGYAESMHRNIGDGSYDIQRYDNNGNTIYHQVENETTEYIYDDEGRVLFEEHKREVGKPYNAKYEYNEYTQIKHISYADGTEKVELRDNNGNFLAQFTPDMLVEINYHEEENSIEIVFNDAKWIWTYDDQNLMIKKELVDYVYNGSFTEIYEYDVYGNLLKRKDNNGKVIIEKIYDKYGKLVEEKLMSGNVHKYKYNENNRLICDECYNSSGEMESKYEYFYE